MTDDNHRPTTEAVPLPPAQPHHADGCDNRHAEGHGRKRDPVLLDLEDVVARLRAMGVRCRQGEDGLWAGKLCLHARGEVSVDGRVRGLDPAHLGHGVEGFIEALRRIGMISGEPKQSASGNEGRKRGYPWCRLHHRPPPRLKGKRAAVAVDRMCTFLDEHELSYEQLGPGRFLICRRIYYSPSSGRIRLKGSRTHPAKGLVALAKVLAEEANNPKLGHIYPSSLRQQNLGVLVADDPLERAWAGSMAARALAMAARSRPARDAVAQEG